MDNPFPPKPDAVLLSCEHAGNRIPDAYTAIFVGYEGLLTSHRGYDIGALQIAQLLARRLPAPLFFNEVTRLLVDANRSAQNPHAFSKLTRSLPEEMRKQILTEIYLPYRMQIEQAIARYAARNWQTLHLSVHTFTPILHGRARSADIGLLYDPQRRAEKAFCTIWRQQLRKLLSQLRIRRNYPYRGKADGLTTHLRRRFAPETYLGIELEVNQRFFLEENAVPETILYGLAESLINILC